MNNILVWQEPKCLLMEDMIAYIGCSKAPIIDDVFVINADGTEKKKQITNKMIDNQYFEWSPDSNKSLSGLIVRIRVNIYVINADVVVN